jgi:hypothetical protein
VSNSYLSPLALRWRGWLGIALVPVLAACGGGGSSGSGTDGTYALGGRVTGLGANKVLVLQNSLADDLTISADGTFAFATRLAQGTAYAVTVKTQPVGQVCALAGATGVMGTADVTNVDVVCSTGGGQPPVVSPVLVIADYVGDWAAGPCVASTSGTFIKTLIRSSRINDNTVRYEQGGVVFTDSTCTGAGTVPLVRDLGTVTVDAYLATANVGAAYGTWVGGPINTRVIWAKKGPNLLCVLSDTTPTLFPTAADVETYLSLDTRQEQNCYTKR